MAYDQLSFSLCFALIITLLVVETNRYYDYTDRLNNGPFPEPDVTEAVILVFLVITIHRGHGITDKPTDCWGTVDQLYKE
jgi:hypothetical protein